MIFLLFLTLSFLANLVSAIVQSPFKGQPLKGFNYDAKDVFGQLFPVAKSLAIGTAGFSSARTYTAMDPASADPLVAVADVKPLAAFEAAVSNQTALLIGLACSLGDDAFNKELAALEAVLKGDSTINVFKANLVVGILVGNEDLYRTSIQGTPAAASQGAGDTVANIKKYIKSTYDKLATYGYEAKIPIGHADTWQVWTDDKWAKPLIPFVDFIGMQAFLYWQGYDIHNTSAYATEALAAVSKAATDEIAKNPQPAGGGAPPDIWATETGWPTQGAPFPAPLPLPDGTTSVAVASPENAQYYWKKIGCDTLFGSAATSPRFTWWFRLFAAPAAPAPGSADAGIDWSVIKDPGGTPAFNLDCNQPPPDVPTGTVGTTPTGVVRRGEKARLMAVRKRRKANEVPR